MQQLANQLKIHHGKINGVLQTNYRNIPNLTILASSTNGTSGLALWKGKKVYFYKQGEEFHVERD